MSTDSPGGESAGPSNEERAAERAVVDLALEAVVGNRTCQVAMFDLSVEGCKMETSDRQVAAGEDVAFTLPGGHPVTGRVVWTQDGYAGVFFDQPLHEALVAHLKFKPAAERQELRDRFGRALPTGNRNAPPE